MSQASFCGKCQQSQREVNLSAHKELQGWNWLQVWLDLGLEHLKQDTSPFVLWYLLCWLRSQAPLGDRHQLSVLHWVWGWRSPAASSSPSSLTGTYLIKTQDSL